MDIIRKFSNEMIALPKAIEETKRNMSPYDIAVEGDSSPSSSHSINEET